VCFHAADQKAKNTALVLMKKEDKWKNAFPEGKKAMEKATADELMAKWYVR
jgi:hypothetical protein